MLFKPIEQNIYLRYLKFLTLKVITYFFLASCFLLFSCNDKVERPAPILKKNVESKTYPGEVPKPANRSNKDLPPPEVVATQRAQALAILNHRLKNDSDSYEIVESGVWEYQFVHSGSMSKPGEYDGVWIDFKDDHTYTYGTKSTQQGSGKYNYHFERGEVLLVDNDSTKKPQEWTVKAQGDVMIMVGTSTYNDNHTQQKLINRPEGYSWD